MPLTLEIVTPEAKVYSDTIDSVVIPTVEGEIGVLPGHAPLLSELGIGQLSYVVNGSRHKIAVAGGVVGGLLGHQVGGGKGKTLATVAGVAGGADDEPEVSVL